MAQVATGVEINQVALFVDVHELFSTLDVDPDGTELDVAWPAVSGATGVEVEAASLALYPIGGSSVGRALSTVAGAFEGSDLTITIPGGPLAIRSFHLNGFEIFNAEWLAVHDQSNLPGGWRVAISVPQGNGFSAPAYAAPGVQINPGIVPTLLAGASLQDRTLRLPDVDAPRFRLQVLSGDFPDGLTPQQFRVSSISARAAPEPVDLQVLDAAGQTVWQQDGRLAAASSVDLKAALKRALDASIAAGDGPQTSVTIQAQRPGQLSTLGLVARGRVLRAVGEKLAVACEGQSQTLAIPGPAIDSVPPDSVVGDVVIRHHGMRLHPISDPLPGRSGDLTGPVLAGSAPVLRTLPPEAMRDEELRRIGLVVIVRESVDLTVRVMEVVGGSPTRPLGDGAATATVEPLGGFAGAQPRVVWLDLPSPVLVDRSIAIEATATRGRLHWVAGEGGAPAVRFAVTIADPAGTMVLLGGQAIAITGLRTELLGQILPPTGFAGGPPIIETDQFCDLVVSNLTLEYRA